MRLGGKIEGCLLAPSALHTILFPGFGCTAGRSCGRRSKTESIAAPYFVSGCPETHSTFSQTNLSISPAYHF